MDEALDQVAGATNFSHIDSIGAYHQMRIPKEDIPKTAICTRFESLEWRVLTFGLTNAPVAFSRQLATVLQDLAGEYLILFLDDLLVYSRSIQEHKEHPRRLFSILREHKLCARRSKCRIGVNEVDYLGYKISADGVNMQRRLVDSIVDWPTPTFINEVRQFRVLPVFTEDSFRDMWVWCNPYRT